MDKVKVYVDSRFRTNGSVSNSDIKLKLKEALDLQDNTVCCVDDISIPHTWRTIESHNDKLYIIFRIEYLAGGGAEMTVEYHWDPFILTTPEGNYTGVSLAAAIQDLLNKFAVTFLFEVVYHATRGTITIKATSEWMDSNNNLQYQLILQYKPG